MLASASVHVQQRKMAHGRGRQPAPQMASLRLYKSTRFKINGILWWDTVLTLHILCVQYYFYDPVNQMTLIHEALLVSLQKRKLPRLPPFDCYMCEMGSKLHCSLLPFTQRAPPITNDNCEISEGCLSKMAGAFTGLLYWLVGLQWQIVYWELYWWLYPYSAARVSCDPLEGNGKEQGLSTERKGFYLLISHYFLLLTY